MDTSTVHPATEDSVLCNTVTVLSWDYICKALCILPLDFGDVASDTSIV